MVAPKNPDPSEGINEEVTRAEEFRRQLKRAFNRPIWLFMAFSVLHGYCSIGFEPGSMPSRFGTLFDDILVSLQT